MDLALVKAKVDRITSELFDETDFFQESGRDSYGDLFLSRHNVKEIKYFVIVEEIDYFGLPSTTWDDLDLPLFQVRLLAFLADDVKPGAALNKFVVENNQTSSFTKLTLVDRSSSTKTLRIESTLAADTIDTPELRNALIFLIRDCELIMANIPSRLLATAS